MPVCSNRFPSLGLTVTAPLTDSPSIYRGARSLRPLSTLMSTDCRSSLSSRTMSISTGVEKKSEAMFQARKDKEVDRMAVKEDAKEESGANECDYQRRWENDGKLAG